MWGDLRTGVKVISTIRGRIVALVVACVAPASAATGFLTLLSHERGIAATEQSLAAASQSLVLVVERDFAAIEASLNALSTSRSIDAGDYATVHQQAKEVLAQTPGLNLLLIDLPGQQLVNTARPFGQKLPKEKQSALMIKVLETAKPSITNLFYGPVLDKNLVAMVVPVLRDGKVTAFLSTALDANHLRDVLAGYPLPAHWIATVLDANGTVVTSTHDPVEAVGKPGPQHVLDLLKTRPQGNATLPKEDGSSVLATFTRSPSLGWTVVIEVPETVLKADLKRSLWLTMAGTSVLLIVGLYLAHRIGRSVADPIQALIPPALAIGRGTPVTIPALGLREAAQVGEALILAEELLRERETERDLARADAATDGLTGLSNRRHFDQSLKAECDRRLRRGTPLSLIMVDVDHFKAFNDLYGHPAGDDCLRRVAKAIEAEVNRASDLPARYGGEEFAAILPETDLAGAMAVAESVREAIAALAIPHAGAKTAIVTASIGLVTVTTDTAVDPQAIVAKADAQLYLAKSRGRNQVVASEE